MYVQDEVRMLESTESRTKELQIRAEEAFRMRKEIARLEKEVNMLRGKVREDEQVHEEMIGVVQGLYREMVGIVEENGNLRANNGGSRRSPSPGINEKRLKQMTDNFNHLG